MMNTMFLKIAFCKTLALSTLLIFSVNGCSVAAPTDNHATVPESVAEVPNSRRPSEHHFSSGQPSEQQLAEFAELGVENVVNLRPPAEVSEINEAAWVSEQGMAYYHIPIAGGADLTREHVATFHQIMQRTEGESTLVHCASGNRVGAMMALRAAWHQGADIEQAIVLGKRYGLTSLEATVREQLAH